MVTVSYYCPRCGALAKLERDAYLADKCVTPEPLEGWTYADAYDPYGDANRQLQRPYEHADGVVIVCGAAETDGEGCGEPYYLSFVRFEDGDELDPAVSASNVRFDFNR